MFGGNEIVGQKYFANTANDTLFVTSRFMTLQGEGPFRGEPAFFIRLAKCNLNCSFCFVGSTDIIMADGSKKKIKDIQIGDMVMSWNNEKFIPKKVTNTFKSVANKILRVTAGNRKVWVTPEHPFLTSNRGWINAEDLTNNDILVNFSSSERMKMFNPMYDPNNRYIMTQQERQRAALNLSNLWKNEDFRSANIERMKTNNPMSDPIIAAKAYSSRENSKSKLEEKFEDICEGLGLTFIGDGSFTVGHKFPDFIVNGTNKLIEIWAADADFAQDRNEEWIKRRKKIFENHGYECLFIPIMPQDLRLNDKHKIREHVARYIHNGDKVKEIKEVTERAALVSLFGSKTAEKTVYNFEVEDTHTYVANGLVVHNCDTFFDDGDWMTFDQIEQAIEDGINEFYASKNIERPKWTKHGVMDNKGFTSYNKKKMVLVITGGEPMLQKNLGPFLERMEGIFQNTQIESNGTIVQNIPKSTTLVVSPKCSEKNGKAIKYLEPKKEMLARADCLKFVMSADIDSPYNNVPKWAHDWKDHTGNKIFVSPMNIYNDVPQKAKQIRSEKNDISITERSSVDEIISFWEPGLLNMEENRKNHEYTAQYCVEHGFILNLQLHLYASLA